MVDTERLFGTSFRLVFSILACFILGLGTDWGCSVFFSELSHGELEYLACRNSVFFSTPSTSISSMKRTWINLVSGIFCLTVLHEGPCSPAKISHTIPAPTFEAKCLEHASLMF
ncbi:hypothetical protein OS493_035365 [Desmophyllum pertusum]|uniref:Uncharacterized protein n=1 Tax=Desmophyllum pertusum TaxID=174260 RepID=A0A9W9YAS3_9CNID|nr:hypothetical protein OS493_035365 [Desmophyllum pertusum]